MGGGKEKAPTSCAFSEVGIMVSALMVGKVRTRGTKKLAQAQAH